MAKLIFILSFLLTCFAWSQETKSTSAEAPKDGFFSETTIATDFAEHGLTQTQNDPNFRGSLGYRVANFEGGIWGSNVRYPTDAEHLELKFFIGFNAVFSPDFKLTISLDSTRFYKSDDRNFGETDLGLDLYGYRLHFKQNTNFEGTKEASTHVTLGKDFDIPWSLKLNCDVEYNVPKDTVYKKYFSAVLGVSYPIQNVTPSIKAIYNSDQKQFDQRGKPMLITSISARI